MNPSRYPKTPQDVNTGMKTICQAIHQVLVNNNNTISRNLHKYSSTQPVWIFFPKWCKMTYSPCGSAPKSWCVQPRLLTRWSPPSPPLLWSTFSWAAGSPHWSEPPSAERGSWPAGPHTALHLWTGPGSGCSAERTPHLEQVKRTRKYFWTICCNSKVCY